MSRVPALVAAFVTAAAMAAVAQQPAPRPAPQQPAPTFRAGIDVVQVDVSVLDKNRQPVKGLAAGDFTILEDGRPQSIVAFSPVDIPDAVAPPAPWMRDVARDVASNDLTVRRVVVIVMDDAYMLFDPQVTKFAKQIGHAVVDHLGPDDMAAVAFTLWGKRQDITSDRARLNSAIDSLVPHPDLGARAQLPISSASRGSAAPMPGGGPPPCAYRGRLRGNAACVIDTLVTAAEALKDGPSGRKTLVYISAGVPYDFSMTNQDAPDDMAGISLLYRTLQQGNVSIYALDPSGLTADGIVSARLDALRIFAENTGGRATVATNTPWEAVPQIFRENSSYYLLGFRSTNAAIDGRFRRLQVKVNRPDAEVHTRTGYYAPLPEKYTRTKEAPAAVAPVDKALRGGLPGGDLHIEVSALPFAQPGQRDAAVAIAVGLRRESSDARATESINIVAAAFDADWKQRAASRGSMNVSLGSGAADPRYEAFTRLALAPGRYQIRVAADNGELSGSVSADVEIPDFAKALLSTSGLIVASSPHPPGAKADSLQDLAPIVPTTLRDFRPSSRVSAFMRIYQGGKNAPGAVRVTAAIVDDDNKTNFEQTTFFESARFGGSRSVDYQLDLPISKLEAGQHLLTIETSLGRTTLRRTARFVVR